MILEVRQTNAFKSNEFDVISNGNVIYRGNASWLKIMELDKQNKVILTDPNGNMLLHTQYDVVENFKEYSIPFKYWIKGERKYCVYHVLDASENFAAVFYTVERRFNDTRLCISFGNRVIYGYRRCIGLKEIASFYENDVQIGQLTRPRKVMDNLERYYVHFLPEYDNLLPLIAMYTVFYDFLYHNDSGELPKGAKKLSLAYTHDVHDNKYNPDFIRVHFGEQEARRIDELVPEKLSEKEKHKAIGLMIAAWLIPLIVIALTFLLFWLSGMLN